MVTKEVEVHTETRYVCGVCKFPFGLKKDAEMCEKIPTKQFAFNIGDRVNTGTGYVGMVVRRYLESPSPHLNEFKKGSKWGKTHINEYSVAVEPKKRVSDLLNYIPGDIGVVEPYEHMMKIQGSYESALVEKAKKAHPELFRNSVFGRQTGF